MSLITRSDDERLAKLESLFANDWGRDETAAKNNENWRFILTSLRAALAAKEEKEGG